MPSASLIEMLETSFQRCRDLDASLNVRLETFADAVRAISAPFADAVDRLVDRLKQSDVGAGAPQVGEVMPPFLMPDDAGRLTGLDELVHDGPVAITFHRGHWCPYCRISAHVLARLQQRIAAGGGQIIAITPERQKFAKALKLDAGAGFPVLTDLDNGYALLLNLVFWVGEEMERFIAATGLDIPGYQGNKAWFLPVPATFVVGTDGRIKARFVDPDYRKRMTTESLLVALGSPP